MGTQWDVLVPALIGSLLFGGIGIYFARLAWVARRARSWRQVAGRVIESRARQYPNPKTGSPQHQAVVRYRYQVDGRTYEGYRVGIGARWDTSRRGTRRRLGRYAKGQEVAVYVHPTRHGVSTLEPRAPVQVYLFAALGALLAVTAIGAALRAL